VNWRIDLDSLQGRVGGRGADALSDRGCSVVARLPSRRRCGFVWRCRLWATDGFAGVDRLRQTVGIPEDVEIRERKSMRWLCLLRNELSSEVIKGPRIRHSQYDPGVGRSNHPLSPAIAPSIRTATGADQCCGDGGGGGDDGGGGDGQGWSLCQV